ncbi:hypothetical protein LCGC14_0664150 [marine sediment metagenome]|uniref:Uncharacterized protein n=1 Tax=marine sediment metagenome TaxID=412755 RepID=A0A0F9QST6_9ZZZZ
MQLDQKKSKCRYRRSKGVAGSLGCEGGITILPTSLNKAILDLRNISCTRTIHLHCKAESLNSDPAIRRFLRKCERIASERLTERVHDIDWLGIYTPGRRGNL